MRRMNVPASFGPMFVSMFLFASLAATPLSAQAPAAGTTVAVKMVDAVNSASDAAGKQYRASVTRAVDAGNGVTIAQGAAATVTLTASGSGYTAQLSSVTSNGQAVAVTSNSASVTNAAPSAAQSAAASAVGSMLGGFGHHVSTAASVAAAATGQHVSLPTGTTLTFVLGASPAAPAAPAPSSAQPMTASAAPAPNPASSSAATSGASAGGPLTAMYICESNPPPNPSDPGYGKIYLTAAFEAPVNIQGPIPVLEPNFSDYLKATYQLNEGIKCLSIWTIADAQAAQKIIVGDKGKITTLIDTGWRYGQPPLKQGQAGFDPLAPGGIDLTQHRLTTYFCTLQAAGGTSWAAPTPYNAQLATKYVSPVFQADWDSVAVSNAWYAYIRDHYVHDLDQPVNGGTFGSGSNLCGAQSPAMQTGLHQTAMVGSKTVQHIVPVDFTDTPAQAAGGKVVAAQAAAASAAAAAQTAAATFFISCSTSGGAGIDTYYTGVFEIGAKPGQPRGPRPLGASFGGTWMVPAVLPQTVLDDFQAYLTQKGYKFKTGSSSACDVTPTAAATQAAQHKRAYEGGGCSNCGKIVETGWKE